MPLQLNPLPTRHLQSPSRSHHPTHTTTAHFLSGTPLAADARGGGGEYVEQGADRGFGLPAVVGVEGADTASAEVDVREGAHGLVAECEPGNDRGAPPGCYQGQDGGEFHADVGDPQGGVGSVEQALEQPVAGGAGRAAYPWASDEVADAAGLDLPCRRDDEAVGVEQQRGGCQAWSGWWLVVAVVLVDERRGRASRSGRPRYGPAR